MAAGFMTHVTCGLTAKNRDQLRNPTLGNRLWATFTFFLVRVKLLLNCFTVGAPQTLVPPTPPSSFVRRRIMLLDTKEMCTKRLAIVVVVVVLKYSTVPLCPARSQLRHTDSDLRVRSSSLEMRRVGTFS